MTSQHSWQKKYFSLRLLEIGFIKSNKDFKKHFEVPQKTAKNG